MTTKKIDWDRVELDYRTGVWTVRELGLKHGVSHVAVLNRAKKHGWSQDARERVDQAREEKLAQQASADTSIASAVDAIATVQASVISGHKAIAARARETAMMLLEELDFTTEHRDTIIAAASAATEGLDRVALLSSIHKALGLTARTGALQKIAAALSAMVDIERRSHGIDKAPPPEEPYEARLKKLVEQGLSAKSG